MNNAPAHILVVDDSPSTREVLDRNLVAAGYVVHTAANVEEGLRLLDVTSVDLVITDLKMPGTSGLDLIRHVRAHLRNTAVIMITGHASIETAVAAVKEGAENYLSKPFTDDELLSAVRHAMDSLQKRSSGQAEPDASPHSGLIGDSPAMQKVYRAIDKAATTPATVLITGESGTGKELIARAIHYRSERASAAFVPVNCAGIPEGLVESELFGHVKGAFTGAVTTRAGFFIAADGGSIFLDEVGELPLGVQGKLLRVLEDKQVQMVGATRPRAVYSRVLTATNRDLAMLVRKKAFRDDLYFRLNVISIELPPLRDRGDDIVALVAHFLNKFANEAGRNVPRFSDRAWQCIRDYHWPGNIRELENLIQRLVVMCESDEIDAVDLPSLMRFSVPRQDAIHRTLAEVEADHVRNVLASVRGNKTRAAQILGIDRKTLRESLKRYGLTTESEFDSPES